MSYFGLQNQIYIKQFPTKFFFRVSKKASLAFDKAGKYLLLLFVATYRSIGTTYLGGACRFTPSCSEYAVELIQSGSSFFQCFYLISKRIISCRPFGRYGFDPIPNNLRCNCGK